VREEREEELKRGEGMVEGEVAGGKQ